MKRIFDESSIADNRRAILSDRQTKGLWWDLLNIILTDAIILFFILAVGRSIENSFVFVLITLGVFLFLTAPRLIGFVKDINQPYVYMIAGETKKYIYLGRNTRLFIRVKDQAPIMISPSLYRHIRNRCRYRFFLTENSQKVVNFECLEPDVEILKPSLDLKFMIFAFFQVLIWAVFLFLIGSGLYFIVLHMVHPNL